MVPRDPIEEAYTTTSPKVKEEVAIENKPELENKTEVKLLGGEETTKTVTSNFMKMKRSYNGKLKTIGRKKI